MCVGGSVFSVHLLTVRVGQCVAYIVNSLFNHGSVRVELSQGKFPLE